MENRGRTLSVDFANAVGRTVKAQPLTAIDYGQILEIHGLPLPPSFECHFSKNGATAYKSIGTTANGIGTVPFVDEQTQSGGIITAYIYLHETADDGETEYRIIIPVESRPGVTPAEPTPVEQDVIAQAISALNNAVTTTTENVAITEANKNASAEHAQNAYEYADDASRSASSAHESETNAEQARLEAVSARDRAIEAKDTAHSEAQYAKSYSESAHTDAQSAGQSATSAQASATSASNSATLAQQYASTATAKASEAMQSAQSASTSAQTASQSAQSAQNSATQANTSATSAQASATSATASEASASASATSAQESAESAQASADRAEQEADRWYEFLPVDTASGSLAHFTDGAKDVPVKSLSVSLEPIQSGSGDPSPDNVRPITGHTQVVVNRTGKNLLENITATSGARTFVGGTSVNDKHTLKPGTYTLSVKDVTGNVPAGLYASPNIMAKYNTSSLTFTIEEETECYFYYYFSDYQTVSHSAEWFQLELSSTASSYEPYSGQSITIPLGDTVYGGTLDVTNGVLTVDRGMVERTSANQWRASQTAGVYYINNGSTCRVEQTVVCDKFKGCPNKNARNLELFEIAITTDLTSIVLRTDDADVDTFKARLDEIGGFNIVRKLATPTTINLTPQQMTTLLGINNVWSDSGDVSVDYRADVQLYIQKMIANALNA